MRKQPIIVLLSLLVGLCVSLFLGLVGVEATFFLRNVWRYSKMAEIGIPLPPMAATEALVVLTGERGRIPKSVDLLRNRRSPLLIISGALPGVRLEHLLNSQKESSANAQEIWKRITLETKSTSTIENARESAKILKKRDARRVILITSEFHLIRSLELFKRFSPAIDFLPYPLASDVTKLRLGELSRIPSALGKLWFEFWKYFLVKHYFIYQLEVGG